MSIRVQVTLLFVIMLGACTSLHDDGHAVVMQEVKSVCGTIPARSKLKSGNEMRRRSYVSCKSDVIAAMNNQADPSK